MADTKISAATAVTTTADSDQYATNQGGASKRTTLAQIKTHPFPAGSASANSWPKFTPGTLLTTPEDGAIELDADCFYGCTDAGNRGVFPIVHMIRADTTRTYTSNTSAQPVFNVPTNGRLTLETGCYRFQGLLAWTAMEAVGASNRSLDILGAGTATVGSWLWQLEGIDNANLNALVDLDAPLFSVSGSAASMVTGVAAATLRCKIQGSFEITGAGTLIPSTTMVVAAASVLSIGSFLEFWRVGSTSMTAVGQWD